MTVLQITCDNCGAKYKLPPTFTGAQAKCQKCGSVIDVQKQRASSGQADAPAAARPAVARPAAAARPAVDRSKPAAKEPAKAAAPAAAAAKPARASRSSARTAKGDDAGDEGGSKRSGRERPAKKSNSMPLIASGVGLVAIVVVVVVMFRGGDDKTAEPTASNDKPSVTKPAAEQPATPAPAPEKPAEPAPEAPKAAATATPAAPAATPTEASTPPPAAEPDDPTRVKRPWEKLRNPPQSIDQITDPKSYPEPTWPAAIADAKKQELQTLAETASDSGIRAIRARKSLADEGYGALFAIVERLRLLNYSSTEDSGTAFAFNKLLEEITGGMTAGFEPIEASETIPPAKAEWNVRTVKGWLGLLARFPDEESFRKARAELLKKQADK